MTPPLPPTLRSTGLAGHYREFQRDPVGLFTRALQAHGDVVRVRFFHVPVTVVNDPEGVREVLSTASENYPRESKSSRIMRRFIGDGILTANGEHWQMQRSALAPHLQGDAVEVAWGITNEILAEGFSRWDAKEKKLVDIAREIRVLSFRILCRLLFAYEATSEEAEGFTDAVSFGQEDVMDRLLSLVSPPLFWPIDRNRKLRSAMAYAHQLCAKILREGNRAQGSRSTYLDAVLKEVERSAPPGKTSNEEWGRQLMMTLLIVGAENPSNTVAWALALLAQHPEWLTRIRQEISEAGRLSTPSDLSRIPTVHRVIHETLRLYPGGWALDRQAAREHTLAGFRIPAGAVVLVSPLLMHRNSRYWKDPESFDPDRFLPERRETMPKFAFYPFGGGPHQCMGPRYAYQTIPLLLVRILERFDYELTGDALPKALPLFTLRPAGGVPLRIQMRN
jgi:cytochrome P450